MIKTTRYLLLTSAAAITLVSVMDQALAGPQGGVVVGGSAAITQSGSKTDIHQHSDKAILDWRSFDIDVHEHVEFHQPSSRAIALNRINDTKASNINGALTANGHVILINPNGVVFGSGAQVDVGSLTASTADIDNDDFMAGKMNFNAAGNSDGAIVNHGSITAKEAGLINLVAPKVENHGIISAKLGKVQLAAADTFALDMAGDGLLQVAVSEDQAQKLARNTGLISAEGGMVALTAERARSIVDSLVENSGIIEASSMTKVGGKIILGGGDTGLTVNRGILDASGRKHNVQGGQINVLGQHIAIAAGSLIDASGNASVPVPSSKPDTATMSVDRRVKTEAEFMSDVHRGGGSIMIGGDYLGTGDTPRAQTLYVDANSLTLNDALANGDGGRTIFWSDHATDFNGLVLARGGMQSGNGGFLETSGKINLRANGFADLTNSAAGFAKGTYLLDPADIMIYGHSSGTIGPDYVSTDGISIDLASDLSLWLDAADPSTITLTYSANALGGATASGTMGTNTIITSADVSANLEVGARIRLGAQGAITTADNIGSDTYTITDISDTMITVQETLTKDYAGENLRRGLVSQWADKAGSNNAIQNNENLMPMWLETAVNGNAKLNYDRSGQYLNLSNIVSGERTAIATYDFTAGEFFQTGRNTSTPGSWSFSNSNFSGWTDTPVNNCDLGYCNVFTSGQKIVSSIMTLGDTSLYQNGQLAYTANETHTISAGYVKVGSPLNGRYAEGNGNEILLYSDDLSNTELNLVEQYQSLKWGINLDPLAGAGTEAAEAMASTAKGDTSNGFGAFSTRYLEKLSQTADIVLAADNSITLDLQGDVLELADNRSISLTTTNNDIRSVSAGSIVTNNVTSGGNITMTAGGNIDLSGLSLDAQGAGNIALTSGAAGTITIDQTINSGTGNLTLKADEIDISANLSGAGNIQLTNADVSQEIEIGSTNVAALNLTAAELDYMQDGWDLITIGGNDHEGLITVNEAVAFSDHTYLRNIGAGAGILASVDINASVTTTDNSDLYIRGRASGGGPHGFAGVHIGADLNIARDLYIISASPDLTIATNSITAGRDIVISGSNTTTLNADFLAGRNFDLQKSGGLFATSLHAGRSIDAGGDISFNVNEDFVMQVNSSLNADGNISIKSLSVVFDPTAIIAGNNNGSSNLTFLEYGQNAAMEIGGTSAGHNWQMTAAELATIQDGFNSITFGSNEFTQAIDFTGAVSFSDNVRFLNTGNNATITIQDTFTTTHNADATFESGSAANVGWDAVNIDADLNIAGNLITRSGAGTGAGHVDINNSTIAVGGNWNILSDYNGRIDTNNLNVGGDVIAERGSKLAAYHFEASNAVIGGDFNIDAPRYIRIYGNYDVDGAITFNSRHNDDLLNIQGGLISGSTINISGAGNITIAQNLTSNGNIVINADNNADQIGAISILNAVITTNGGDFIAGGGNDPRITAAYAAQDGSRDIGVALNNAQITTGAGNISIRGVGENTGDSNYGVYLYNSSQLETTTGTVTIQGVGGDGDNQNDGINMLDRHTSIVSGAGNITLNGTGGAGLNSNRGILMTAGAHTATMIRSNSGNISLTGNSSGVGADNVGIFIGANTTLETFNNGNITLDGTGGLGTARNYGTWLRYASDLRTVDGDITIYGQGRGSENHNYGVYIHYAPIIRVTGDGDIYIEGSGGDGISNNYGVVYDGYNFSATELSVADGNINIIGQGGSGAGSNNYGIYLLNNANISSTGENAGDIRLLGIGGGGTSAAHGIFLHGDGTDISSNEGDIIITGTGGNSGSNNNGIRLEDGAAINSLGTMSEAAKISLVANSRTGDALIINGGTLTSGYGDIHLTSTVSNSGRGFFLSNYDTSAAQSKIISTGSGDDAADIIIDATTPGGDGVFLHVGGAIETHDGNIDINATGRSHGMFMRYTSYIQSTGDGDIIIDATTTGNTSTELLSGFDLRHGSFVSAVDGDISIKAVGGNSVDATGNGHGISMTEAGSAYIQTTGAGNILLDGTAGNCLNGGCHGVYLAANTAASDFRITSTSTGNIDITGRGGNNGSNNYGIFLEGGSNITSTATGANAGTITLNGTGGDGLSNNYGVYLTHAGTRINSNDGAILIAGHGGSNGSINSNDNYGIYIADNADINSIGTSSNAATINLNGIGGDGYDNNIGVNISGFGVTVNSVTGNIHITGQGGADAINGRDGNHGVRNAVAFVTSTGAGADAATITVLGTAGRGRINNNGVEMTGSSQFTSQYGDISITGIGGTNTASVGRNNRGIRVSNGSNIQSTGTLADAANITLLGTGAAADDFNDGISVESTGSIRTVNGNIDITGQAGSNGLVNSENNHGVRVVTDGFITSNGVGAITIDGAGANGGDGLRTETGTINLGGANASSFTIIADSLSFINLNSLQTAGNLTILNQSAGTSIGLGGGTGQLNLDDAELAQFNVGGDLTIGAANAGALHIDSVDFAGITSNNVNLYGEGMIIDGHVNAGNSLSIFANNKMTLNGSVSAAGAGNSVVLVANSFENYGGALAIDSGAGRYLVYTNAPGSTHKGGLGAGNLYNRSYSSNLPAAIEENFGSLFVYEYQPTLTITADDIMLNTFQPNFSNFTYKISGLENDDIAASVFSGIPVLNKSQASPGIYNIDANIGSLASLIGYDFSFVSGTLQMLTPAQQLNSTVEYQMQNIVYRNIDGSQQISPLLFNGDGTRLITNMNSQILAGNFYAEPDAALRLVDANLMEIETPIIEYYDLCSFNVKYCN